MPNLANPFNANVLRRANRLRLETMEDEDGLADDWLDDSDQPAVVAVAPTQVEVAPTTPKRKRKPAQSIA